jgi:hypothetical protein
VLHIGRQQDTGEVVLVGLEGADRDDASGLFILNHAPDVDIALWSKYLVQDLKNIRRSYLLVSSTQQRPIASDAHTEDSGIILGNQLVGADTFSEIPDANHASAITADQLTLVGVNHNIIDSSTVNVVALQGTSASIPNLDSPILRACNHPFALTVECDARDIAGVTFEGHHGVGVGGLDVIELDIVVTTGGEEALIGGDAETIDL